MLVVVAFSRIVMSFYDDKSSFSISVGFMLLSLLRLRFH